LAPHRPAEAVREIEVEADLDGPRCIPQGLRAGRPAGCIHQAADRRHAAARRELEHGAIHAVVQAEVVGTDDDRPRCTGRAGHRRDAIACCAIIVSSPREALFVRPPLHRVVVFVAVGTAAALTHFLAAVTAVGHLGLVPLEANVVGWLCALGVSYGGHRLWTFADHGAPALRSALRFTMISAGGFAINECAYAICLRYTPFRYDVLLAAILLAVATLTYLLSRHWAFTRDALPRAPGGHS
jgi:putative flippase GtrA